ncbi:hypothetical protein [Glycomyces sp. NPDC048151]|uniref:hypothetical protein n=1 Tax=Glycomyces sp. NPDC048151 TaxID=3364002 RepID=UPI003718592F
MSAMFDQYAAATAAETTPPTTGQLRSRMRRHRTVRVAAAGVAAAVLVVPGGWALQQAGATDQGPGPADGGPDTEVSCAVEEPTGEPTDSPAEEQSESWSVEEEPPGGWPTEGVSGEVQDVHEDDFEPTGDETVKPEDPTDGTGDCAEDPSEEPTDVHESEIEEEPTDSEASEPGEEPTDAGEEPTDQSEEPTDAGEEPTDQSEEPTDAGEEPTEDDPSEESTP